MAKARTKRRSEHLFQGVGVSGGIAIGPAHVVTPGAAHVPRHAIARRAVSAERKRFAEAVDKARKQIQKLVQRSRALPAGAAEEVGFLLDASLAMLGRSRLVRGVDERIARDLVNAEAAVEDEIAAIAHGFAQMADEYFAARVNDVREVGARLVRNLTREPYQAFSDLPAGTILVAEELTPADTALMDPSRIAGFVASAGGIEGHTAIMARALSLPSVLGVPDLLAHVLHGDDVIVDGESGQVVINPTAATRQRFDTRRRALQRRMRQLARLRDLPAETRDGEIIQLQANLELPRELDTALAAGASGVGLLRSEFVFMNRSDLPSEDEQYLVLRTLVDGMAGRPITVRTLDVGGEKLWDSLGGMSQGPNPVLGLRAIRLSLRYPALLETQLAAILRAGAHGPLRILLPMISTVAEVTAAR
ncbi:MAG: putative PEP-binding protein, partial [Alphaproteobacteria bacterium]